MSSYIALVVFSSEFFSPYPLLFVSHRCVASDSGGVVPPALPTASIVVVDVLSAVMPPPKPPLALSCGGELQSKSFIILLVFVSSLLHFYLDFP